MRAVFAALAVLASRASGSSPGYLTYDEIAGSPYAVTYDNRSLFINGQRTIFNSFGIHYTRATASQWDDILGKAATDGYNMVQTYVFWNAHAHKEGGAGCPSPGFGSQCLRSPCLDRLQSGI